MIQEAIRQAQKQHRKILEETYVDCCNVYEYQAVKDKKTNITEPCEVVILKELPCKLSFQTIQTTTEEKAAKVTQNILLFLSPDSSIPSGSKLVITHEGITQAYSRSGISNRYATHQEIPLELFRGWS